MSCNVMQCHAAYDGTMERWNDGTMRVVVVSLVLSRSLARLCSLARLASFPRADQEAMQCHVMSWTVMSYNGPRPLPSCRRADREGERRQLLPKGSSELRWRGMVVTVVSLFRRADQILRR